MKNLTARIKKTPDPARKNIKFRQLTELIFPAFTRRHTGPVPEKTGEFRNPAETAQHPDLLDRLSGRHQQFLDKTQSAGAVFRPESRRIHL